jgi:UDP-glucose 4-epimerase
LGLVVITGVAGFLGSHIADAYLAKGWQVCGIDNLLGGSLDNVPAGVEFYNHDLDDLEAISPVFVGADLVIHSACTAYEGLSVFSPALVVRNTVQTSVNVMTASIRAKVPKFVYMSSMARYGNNHGDVFVETLEPKPQDPYGISKLAAEKLLTNLAKVHDVDLVVLVPHNIVGARQKFDDPFRNVASIMTNRMLQGKQPVIYGDGTQLRCFSFIQDVIAPIMTACESPEAVGQVINIGPDESPISILELAKRLAAIIGFELDPIFMPGRPQEVYVALCSSDKARQLLGYETTVTLDQGLRDLVDWIRPRVKDFEYHLPIEIDSDLTPKTWTQRLI